MQPPDMMPFWVFLGLLLLTAWVWRLLSQRSFRLEAWLRNAELCQDNDLANALARRLVNLMQEQNRTSEAFVEHQAKDHPQKGAVGVPPTG